MCVFCFLDRVRQAIRGHFKLLQFQAAHKRIIRKNKCEHLNIFKNINYNTSKQYIYIYVHKVLVMINYMI